MSTIAHGMPGMPGSTPVSKSDVKVVRSIPSENRLSGVIVRLPIRDRKSPNGDVMRERNGEVRLFPHVRYVDKDGYEDFLVLREHLEGSTTAAMLQEKIPVRFRPDRIFALEVERVYPRRESRRWNEAAVTIAKSNGVSGWLPADVKYYNAERGFGFAQLLEDGGEVFFHIRAVVRRDRGVEPVFVKGDRVHVQDLRSPRDAGGKRSAGKVFFGM